MRTHQATNQPTIRGQSGLRLLNTYYLPAGKQTAVDAALLRYVAYQRAVSDSH